SNAGPRRPAAQPAAPSQKRPAAQPAASTGQRRTAAVSSEPSRPQPAAQEKPVREESAAVALATPAPAIAVVGQSYAEDLFANGLNRQEWINGIIVSEILSPPLSKRGRAYRR
nr:hypothetical protein [Bacillota bacterium]